jgi:RimJ/RimL family protein N-acetyltransferase
MPVLLGTERLILRPWHDADVGELRRLHAERGAGAPTLAEARQLITDAAARSARTGLALLVVHRRAENDVIGYCGLITGRSTEAEPELAFELFRRVHDQGYATEAAAAVVTAAAATGRCCLWATVRPWNSPSFRVLEKLGFHRDHTTTDDRGELVWLRRPLP